MATYLSNAFSLNMVNRSCFTHFGTFFRIEEVNASDIPNDVVSVIGHADTANVVSGILGFDVPCNRTNLSLKTGDVLYVAQYTGPRLPEGATSLPEGALIQFYRIDPYYNPTCACGGIGM